MKILTIIIPSYNISKFIDKIMNSLLVKEVIDKLQILLVNDGSTDNTLELAQVYEKQYPNSIQVLDKENGGHGSTINYGIKFSQGKYIKVIDGDDWVDSQVLIQLVNYLEKVNVDVVAANYCTVNENNGIKKERKFNNIEYNKIYHFENICSKVSRIDFHSIIYNKRILDKNKWTLDEHCFYVDIEYILFPLVYVDTIIFFRDNFYMYRIGDTNQSISMNSFIKNRTHLKKVALRLAKFYEIDKIKMSYNKRLFILKRIKSHIFNTFIILLGTPHISKQELKTFDKKLKNSSLYLYNNLSIIIKLFRIIDYKGAGTKMLIKFINTAINLLR